MRRSHPLARPWTALLLTTASSAAWAQPREFAYVGYGNLLHSGGSVAVPDTAAQNVVANIVAGLMEPFVISDPNGGQVYAYDFPHPRRVARLWLSTPAMSHALARIRDRLTSGMDRGQVKAIFGRPDEERVDTCYSYERDESRPTQVGLLVLPGI